MTQNTNIEDIELVYNTFYHPKNMFLVVTGNVNPYEIEQIVNDNLKDKTLLNACLSQSTTNIQIKQAINELKNEVSIAMQNVLDKKKGKRKPGGVP